jgi:hypothetical protein
MKLILTTAAVILAGLAFTQRASAQDLVNVDFSLGSIYGGTITGELVGLQDNATSAPTDVLILSGTTKTKYGPVQSFPETLPFDFGTYTPTQTGEFTLVNGVVTNIVGGFQISESTPDQAAILQLNYGMGGGGTGTHGNNELSVTTTNPDSSFVALNEGYGFNGVLYSQATPDAVPEPSAYALTLLGLGALAMLKLRRQRAKV